MLTSFYQTHRSHHLAGDTLLQLIETPGCIGRVAAVRLPALQLGFGAATDNDILSCVQTYVSSMQNRTGGC